MDNPYESCVIKEKMARALRFFKESTEHHILVQVWAPVKTGDRYVLTTSGQPFVLDPTSTGLHQYRTVSLMYMFSVDGESDGELGLPGRVFRQKLPEWTPDVQFYTRKEYPRLNHAMRFNVHGSLALPVFEPSGQHCVGVLELIMTHQKINYASEVDKVCKALEAVDLKSSEVLDHPIIQICNEGRQKALAEILEILTVVCETHKLPLAQTWVPCRHRSVLAYGGGLRKSCSSFDGSCMGQVCMSTTDAASYIVDAHMWGFREACAEHHLQIGQGVAGRAFASQSSCFYEDVTKFSKAEYPLVHYARMFGLTSCFALCLQSAYTGNDDYILEFFLPLNIRENTERQLLLDSLLGTIKKHLQSLKVASGKELEEEWKDIEIIRACSNKKLDLELEQNSQEGNDFPNGGEVQNSVPAGEHKEINKKSERKRGKAEKTISLDVLQQYFSGSLKDAAKSLGVCPTTMKRICRQHGISRWPSRKINKVNRSLSKLQSVIESVQGAEGAFTLTSIAASTLPVAVNAISRPDNLKESNQLNSFKSPVNGIFSKNEIIRDQNDQITKLGEGSCWLKSSGSREENTSHGSNESSSKNDTISSPGGKSSVKLDSSFDPLHQQIGDKNLSVTLLIPDALLNTQPQEPFGAMLVEDAGSSHDLRNLCPLSEALMDGPVPSSTDMVYKEPLASPLCGLSQFSTRAEAKMITIKATYRQDIIRFRFSLDSGIFLLKEEVAKRLKLVVGAFDIKYLDDDHEWVKILCDSDLRECIDISKSSGSNIIRLLVQDVMNILGSSCES